MIATVGGAAAGFVVGAACAWTLATRRRAQAHGAAATTHDTTPPGPAGAPATTLDATAPEPASVKAAPATAQDATPPGPAGAADREALVQACIDLSDRLRDANPALWRRMCRGLAAVGVEVLVADGQRFDPDTHDAVGREPTADAARHLTVATTEFCGFTDRGRLLRRPEVVVYRLEETT
jgi:hypothetical protein